MAKRKKTSRVIAPLVLIVLAAILFLGFYLLKKAEDDTADIEETEEAINIITSSADDIVNLTFDGGYGEFALEKIDGTWYLSSDSEFPLNQTIVNSMLGTVSTVNAVRTVEGGDDSDYGFEEPSCTVTAVYEDGETRSYTLGIVNSHNSNQYLKCDDGSVYMVTTDFATSFEKSENDLLAGESLPDVSSTNTVSVTVMNAAGESMILADEDAIVSGVDAFNALDYLTIDRIYAPGGDMSAYGITDMSPYITVYYTESDDGDEDTDETAVEDDVSNDEILTYTIYFGNTYTEDGYEYVYYSHPGSLVVYSISKDYYDDAMELVYYTPETDSETEVETVLS